MVKLCLVHEDTKLCILIKVSAKIKTNELKKECYLITQDNTIHKILIKLSFSSIGLDKSKLQKQIINKSY